MIRPTNAYFEPIKLIGTDLFDDIFDAILTSGGAFFFELVGACRLVKIIMDDQQMRRRDFEKLHKWCYTASGEIHKCGGFGDDEAVSTQWHRSTKPVLITTRNLQGCFDDPSVKLFIKRPLFS